MFTLDKGVGVWYNKSKESIPARTLPLPLVDT